MATAPDDTVIVRRRPLAARIATGVAIALGVLVALVLALALFLNTGPGKRFIGRQLEGFTTASGINVRVRAIDGSIYSRFTLRGLEVRDGRGVFLDSPAVTIDWSPFAYVRSKIALHEVASDLITLRRLPVLKPTPSDPNAPTIPDIDLALAKLHVGRFVVEPPVDGRRHIVRLDGRAAIADRRAQIDADAAAIAAPGVAGGDRFHLTLDAVPDANRLRIAFAADAPAGGLVDSYAHLGKPLRLSLGGRGDWHRWDGTLAGTLGGQALADVGVTARDGTFRATGRLMPGLMLSGPAARMVAPALALDATAALDRRRANTTIKLRSAAFAAQAGGLLDFATSRFGGFRVDARLLTPGAILPQLSGRDVRVSAVLDGAFARPAVAYDLAAGAIAFGTTGVEALHAAGRATIDADRIRVPIHATARRVTGLNAAAGGLVTNIRVDGDLAYQNGQILSDNLRLRSDRIDATALVLADLTRGTYTGALKGRVNDYAVNGLGRINLFTDARLVTAPGGGFGIRGRVRIVTRRITNATLAQQLGGNATITADVGYDPAGVVTVRNLRETAPDFVVTRGQGSYRLDTGAMRFEAAGASRTYGPFTLAATGTIADPRVVLKAARPGVGVGLKDLTATLTGTRAGYAVLASAGSDYGPFTADVLVRAGKGPLAIDIRRFLIAGITVDGSVAQSRQGPFEGTLFVTGSGLSGQVRLAAAGANQRADVALRAAGAWLPGPGGQAVTIGSGLVNAGVVLLPNGPSATGSLSLLDLRTGATVVRTARARFSYAGGSGAVAMTAAGSAGVPFDIAAQARLSPSRILANLRGSANGLPFRLAQPAVATRQGDAYVLTPATIVLPQGSVTLSGRYGAVTQLHAALAGLDLSIAQAFAPTLGLGGKATGTVDLTMAGNAVPTARARIDVKGFTRTGALVISQPVDIALLGTLGATGGRADAILRRGADVLGRVRAVLAPIPGGGASWTSRLMQAPLSGGIRYNGPAEVLWTLTGIAGQTVAGPIAVGADFSGRLDRPNLTGVVRANQLRYENTAFGTTIANIQLDGRFTQSQFRLDRFAGKAGDGTVQASGTVGIDAAGGFPMAIEARLDNATLADSDATRARVGGTLSITNSKATGGLIKGDFRIAEARYQIAYQGAGEVPELTGVRRKGAVTPAGGAAAAAGPAPSNWKLDLRVRADNQLFVGGMGMDSEWRTDMRVGGTTGDPRVTGRIQVVRGTFSFAGRRLDLADTSAITFRGPLTNPDLAITASTTVQSTTVSLNVGGTAQRPQIAFTSSPSLAQDEVLSLLLFGGPVSSLTPMQALQLASSLNSLRSGGGGVGALGKVRGATGLDNLSLLGSDKTTGRGNAVQAGKYISKNIYVQVIADTKGFTQTQLTIALSRALSVISTAGGYFGPGVALKYSKQY